MELPGTALGPATIKPNALRALVLSCGVVAHPLSARRGPLRAPLALSLLVRPPVRPHREVLRLRNFLQPRPVPRRQSLFLPRRPRTSVRSIRRPPAERLARADRADLPEVRARPPPVVVVRGHQHVEDLTGEGVRELASALFTPLRSRREDCRRGRQKQCCRDMSSCQQLLSPRSAPRRERRRGRCGGSPRRRRGGRSPLARRA